MMPTAVSQVLEQLFRVSAVIILAFMLFPRGLEYAAAGATFGAVVGGIVGLIVLVIFYFKHQADGSRRLPDNCSTAGHTSAQLARELVALAIPVSLGAVSSAAGAGPGCHHRTRAG